MTARHASPHGALHTEHGARRARHTARAAPGQRRRGAAGAPLRGKLIDQSLITMAGARLPPRQCASLHHASRTDITTRGGVRMAAGSARTDAYNCMHTCPHGHIPDGTSARFARVLLGVRLPAATARFVTAFRLVLGRASLANLYSCTHHTCNAPVGAAGKARDGAPATAQLGRRSLHGASRQTRCSASTNIHTSA